MEELFPVLAGILLGSILGYLPPRSRWLGAIPAILLGVAATIFSGEFRLSWDFLLVDIPLVAISTVISLAVVIKLRQARSERP